MKNYKTTIYLFAILFAFAAFIGTTLIGIGYVMGSRAFEQRNEQLYIEIGYNMGRMQVLDSLIHSTNEKKKAFTGAIKPFRFENALE